MHSSASVVICGAGIGGIAAAYFLAVRRGVGDVVLVDERPPLSLTSDKSTECYRNWWPGPGDGMVRLMNRSIDLMEELASESGNVFQMSRRGYLFVTAEPSRVSLLRRAAGESSSLGAGPVRVHSGLDADPEYVQAPAVGFEGLPTGADLILDAGLIRRHFPYLSPDVVAALHTRRCGRVSAQQLGTYLLDRAREHGARVLCGRVEGIDIRNGRVEAVRLDGEDAPQSIATTQFVNAAGPFARRVGAMMGVDLPIVCELHAKISFSDTLGAMPRIAPLCYWADPQLLPWSEQERAMCAASPDTRWLLEPFPPGPHGIPEGSPGSQTELILWTYDIRTLEPIVPLPPIDPMYFEVVLRGLSRMFPRLTDYFQRLPRPFVDGGYYAKTQENRPLIGPLGVEGAWIIAALSGFGIMAACAAGELLAAHIAGDDLPDYARWFLLDRYTDPEYRRMLAEWDGSGQL